MEVPAATLSRVDREPPGAQCPRGGSAVRSGSDDDGDGSLSADEVDRTDFVCTTGPVATLVRRDEVPAGTRCAHGGIVVRTGLDDNEDGRLGDDEVDRDDVTCHPEPPAALVRRDLEPTGAQCPFGGVAVRTGLDDDGDGALSDAEIDRSEYACNAPPPRALVRRDDEPAGSGCEHGGIAVRTGLDDDGDGVLDDAEVDSTSLACDDAPLHALADRVDEPAGSNCPDGGAAIRSGVDRDRDGVLDPAEVEEHMYVCADAPGRAVFRRDDEPAGANCAAGGIAIRTGLDANRNGVLEDAEVDATTYACDVAGGRAVLRRDDEPAGANCAHGGAAVRTGLDLDGNGRLDDAEIQATAYACHPAPVPVLVRSDVEVPGTSCPHGGIAVHSGRDVDGNAQLEPSEVETTTFVCSPAPARALHRSDVEPPGPFCALGGTAVRVGVDHDADGLLDEAEIERTVYVCKPPVAALLRERALPSDSSCPRGGTAIDSGVDDNENGVLDDSEVDETVRRCSDAEVVAGDLYIDDFTTPAALARYATVRVVTGDLVIAGGAEVTLPALQLVGGSLVVRGTAQRVRLSLLGSVGRRVEISSDTVTEVELDRLRRIGDRFDVLRAPALAPLVAPELTLIGGRLLLHATTGLSAPSLLVVQAVEISGAGSGTVALPALTHVAVLTISSSGVAFQLPALSTAGNVLLGHGLQLDDLALPALQSIDGDLRVFAAGLRSLSLYNLTRVGGEVAVTLTPSGGEGDGASPAVLESLQLNRLRRVGRGVAIEHAPALATANLASLAELGGSLRLRKLPSLTEVHLGALHDIDAPGGHALDISETGLVALYVGADDAVLAGMIHIAQNPALERVYLAGVVRTGVVLVHGNPELRSLAAETLWRADGVEVSGNPKLSHLWMGRLSRITGTLLVQDTALVDLVHFGDLTELGDLAVVSNPALRTIGTPTSVRSVRNLTVTGNPELTSLLGLDRVETITGNLAIADNASLTTLAGLGHVRVVAGSLGIQDCPGLASLSGLEALRVVVGDLAITGNLILSSLAGTERLVEVGAAVAITDNAQLPAAEIAGLMTRIGRLP